MYNFKIFTGLYSHYYLILEHFPYLKKKSMPISSQSPFSLLLDSSPALTTTNLWCDMEEEYPLLSGNTKTLLPFPVVYLCVGCGYSSSSRVLTWHAQGPRSKDSTTEKKYVCVYTYACTHSQILF